MAVPCACWQWLLWLLRDHTSGAPVCHCIARPNLGSYLMPWCGLEWVEPDCLPLQIRNGDKVASTLPPPQCRLFLPWMLACPHACSRVLASPVLCLRGFLSRQGRLSLLFITPGLECPAFALTCTFPGWQSTHMDFLFLTDCLPVPEVHVVTQCFFFSILPDYMGTFLSNLFSVTVVPHKDVFLMYLWEEVTSTFYSPSWTPLSRTVIFDLTQVSMWFP